MEDKLDKIIDLLETLVKTQARDLPQDSPNPWPVDLIMEYQSGEDQDGNGLAFGHDFCFDENASAAPPIFQGVLLDLERGGAHFENKMSWEDYRDSLPDGHQKDKVSRFVERVGSKI